MMDYIGLVRRDFMTKMLTSFTKPKHLETDDQSRRWLDSFVQVLAEARPTEAELHEVWARLIRQRKVSTWPMPAEVYSLLIEFRGGVPVFGGEDAWAKRRAPEVTPEEAAKQNREWWARRGKAPMTVAQAMDVCRERAPTDPLFRRLLAMGEAFDRRGDRESQRPQAREYVP